jgi:hypothetical protein
VDLDQEHLPLAAAALRIAARDGGEARAVSYGRPSAAEEKLARARGAA